MKIEVLIEEIRTRVVEVEADSPNEAIEIVRKEYKKGDHDLSKSENIWDTEFSEIEK